MFMKTTSPLSPWGEGLGVRYKCMQGKLQNTWRDHIIFIMMIVMFAALFFSRALLSISMAAFVVFSFVHNDIAGQIKRFFSSPLLWGMSMLFFLPLISGLWSDDKSEWWLMVQIKAPLFLLPLAFAGPINLSKQQWHWLAYTFILIITGASLWSMFHYAGNAAAINEGYLRAKTLITPLENDHVRFSWLVSVAVLAGAALIFLKRKNKDAGFWLLVVAVSWLIVFLHILAARTGLFSFYILLCGSALWLIIKKLNWKYSIGLLLVIVALPFIAYKTLPSLQNRVKYFIYEFDYLKKTNYLPGANDAVRIISLKAGRAVMQQQPLTGVGFGDILFQTKKWYGENYPQMIEADKIYPSGEWAMYGTGCGWPGLLIFFLVMFIPFAGGVRQHPVWILLNITAVFSLLFDPGLEVQFGVFSYSFIVLCCRKWLSAKKM